MPNKSIELENLREPKGIEVYKAQSPAKFKWKPTKDDIQVLKILFGRLPTEEELLDLKLGRGRGPQGYKK